MFLKRTKRKIKQRLFTGQEVMGAGKNGARARDTRVSLVSLASPQTSFGVRLSRIHFSPKGRLRGGYRVPYRIVIAALHQNNK